MIAVLLQCGIFALFSLVGYAIAVGLAPERDALRNALIAPVLGAAAFTLSAILLNHAGLPVGAFATGLTVALTAGAALVLWLRRGRAGPPWRDLAPFLALLPLALVLTCRPSFEFGLNWMSYSNEDMINYSSTAQRLIDYPFYAEAPAMDVASGARLSQEGFWFHDILGNERVGVDTLLAVVSAVTHVRTFNAFMPFIGAGYFMLIWAGAALGLARERRVVLAAGVGFALMLSSLTTLGLLYQLLGQIFGLAATAASIAILGERDAEIVRRNPLGQIVLRVLLFSFVVAAYPELFPFVVLAMLLEYVVVPMLERRRPDYVAAFAALVSIGLSFAVLWNYGITMAHVIAQRFHSATAPSGDLLFPYFLLPSGLANFWGLVKLADYPPDPYMSVAIVAGLLLLALQLTAIVVAARKVDPGALTALVMALLGAAFFVRRDDFALFKMTMYVQPFFAASLALGAYALLSRLAPRRRELTAAAITAGFALIGIGAQQDYVELSRSTTDAPSYRFSQLPMASPRGLLAELDDASKRAGNQAVAIDAPLPEYAKLAAAYLDRAPMATLSDDFLGRFRFDGPIFGVPDAGYVHETAQIETAEFHERETLADLDVPPLRRADGSRNRFRKPWVPATPQWLLELGADASILNRSGDAEPKRLVTLRPYASVRNHLVLLQSEMFGIDGWSGAWEDGAPRGKPTLYRPERDSYLPGTFAGVGRYLAFDAVNPRGPVRLVMWSSATLKADGKNFVPRGHVYGATEVPLAGIGRGSARIVSAPFEPANAHGEHLIGIDLGQDGVRFRKHLSGLMRWFGSDIAIDPRPLVVFGRDVSIVSDADYRRWSAPSWIVDMPHALEDPHLAFSGIYEDAGWVSDDAELTLQSDATTQRVRVEGLVPRVDSDDFATTATLSVDGVQRVRTKVPVGTFTLEAPVKLPPGKHLVRLTFSRGQRFPDPDDRIVGARVDAIGFPP